MGLVLISGWRKARYGVAATGCSAVSHFGSIAEAVASLKVFFMPLRIRPPGCAVAG